MLYCTLYEEPIDHRFLNYAFSSKPYLKFMWALQRQFVHKPIGLWIIFMRACGKLLGLPLLHSPITFHFNWICATESWWLPLWDFDFNASLLEFSWWSTCLASPPKAMELQVVLVELSFIGNGLWSWLVPKSMFHMKTTDWQNSNIMHEVLALMGSFKIQVRPFIDTWQLGPVGMLPARVGIGQSHVTPDNMLSMAS